MRNLGSCFASPILLLLRNGATKYQTLISIIRQAPRRNTLALTLTVCEDKLVLARAEVPVPSEIIAKVAAPVLLPAVPVLTPTLRLVELEPPANKLTTPAAVAAPEIEVLIVL